jgi:hypothetical protein
MVQRTLHRELYHGLDGSFPSCSVTLMVEEPKVMVENEEEQPD